MHVLSLRTASYRTASYPTRLDKRGHSKRMSPGVGGEGVPKIVTKGDIGERAVWLNSDVTATKQHAEKWISTIVISTISHLFLGWYDSLCIARNLWQRSTNFQYWCVLVCVFLKWLSDRYFRFISEKKFVTICLVTKGGGGWRKIVTKGDIGERGSPGEALV